MNKRILSLGLISAVAFGLASCEKVEFQQESSTIGNNFGFIAEISEESRTTNNNSYTTAWVNGDEMEVYYYDSSTKHYTFEYNNWIFTPESSGLTKYSKTWVGVYPKTNSVSFSGSGGKTIKVTLTVPDTFRQAGNNSMSHLAGEDGLPMYGSVTGKLSAEPKMKMSMKQMAAVIKFNITNAYEKAVTISRIEFEAADDNLVGQFTGTLSSDAVSSWSAGTGAAKKVTLNVQDGSSVANGSSAAFYVGTAPFSHNSNKNYTLTVYGTDSEGQELKATKTVSLTMTLASAKVKTINYTFPADATPIVNKTYTKVTAKPDPLDWSGTYLIVDESSKNIFAYDQTGYKKGVTIENNKIVSSELEKYEVTISLSDDGDTGGDHFDIKTSDGKYLYRSSADGNSFLNDSYTYNSHQYYNKIDAGSTAGNFSLTSKYSGAQTTYKFYYNSSSSAFKYSSSSNSVQLYKLEDPRTPQTLSFDDESPEVDINDKKTYTQTVTGAQTDVTYSITSASPSDAATINATTGELTLKKRGTIVVTATAAGTDQYRPAEASYTLTVIDPNAKKTYSKVTAKPDPLDWSGTYLIVDESSKNIFAYDQTGYKKGVTIENNKIVSSELEKYEVTISPATGTDASHYDVKTSDGKYLYRSDSDTGNFLNESYTSASNNKNYYAKIGEETNMISLGTKYSGNYVTEYFFYYNSSSKAFEFKNDKSKAIQLYKLDSSE